MPSSLPRLFIGSTRNEFGADPVTIATLYRFMHLAGQVAPVIVVSEFGHHEGVTTRAGVYDPRENGFEFLATNPDLSDVATDPDLFQRLSDCYVELDGWITFNGEDRIPEDPAERKRIKTRAIDVERERRPPRGDDPAP